MTDQKMDATQVQNLEHRSWGSAPITHLPNISIIILDVRFLNHSLKMGNHFTKHQNCKAPNSNPSFYVCSVTDVLCLLVN